jgi:hypothetical protein
MTKATAQTMHKIFFKKRHTRTLIVVAFFVVLGLYAINRAHNLLHGADIRVNNITDGAVVAESLVTISGKANNATFFSINDRQVFVSENYDFAEKVLLLPGYNVLTLKGEDKFGKKAITNVRIVYEPITPEGDETITSVSMSKDYGKENN